jgi:hypothetical protein
MNNSLWLDNLVNMLLRFVPHLSAVALAEEDALGSLLHIDNGES